MTWRIVPLSIASIARRFAITRPSPLASVESKAIGLYERRFDLSLFPPLGITQRRACFRTGETMPHSRERLYSWVVFLLISSQPSLRAAFVMLSTPGDVSPGFHKDCRTTLIVNGFHRRIRCFSGMTGPPARFVDVSRATCVRRRTRILSLVS